MTVDRDQVGVAVVTRGDVALGPVLKPLRVFAQVEVWDNSREADMGVYGRYVAMARLKTPVVVTVDDDTVLPARTVDRLRAAYEPGVIVCNVPARFRERYTDSGLVGFGAIFDRELVDAAFDRFHAVYEGTVDEEFRRRTCDLVFTMLGGPLKFVDLPYRELPYAQDGSRMWRQPDHFDERERMRRLCRAVRERVAA